MTKTLKDMKIYIIDIDKTMIKELERIFSDEENILIETSELVEFLKSNTEVDCVVTAANSFGIMTGGYDEAIIQHFGMELQDAVQRKIVAEYLGEQPVGSSMIVEIPGFSNIKLIHTPTMRIPEPILDPRVIYSCTRSALAAGIRNESKNMLLPAFGHLTGQVPAEIVAELMYKAYVDICKNSEGPIKPKKCFEDVENLDRILLKHLIRRSNKLNRNP